jgi:hypothetical protein
MKGKTPKVSAVPAKEQAKTTTNRSPIDYTRRDRNFERMMIRENRDHHIWKEKLRKEKNGFHK